jgi:hypothetical protein
MADATMTPAPPLAYVAEGKLYRSGGDGDAQLVDSAFVQAILDRVEKDRQRNDWKADGMAWNLGGRRNPMPGDAAVGEMRRVRFTGVAAGGGDLFYAVDTDHAGGLFHYEPATGYERRLYHRNGLRASDVAHHPTDGTLAFAVRLPDGTSHLSTFTPAGVGRGVRQLTEGDAVDEAPSWAEGEGSRALVFQSAGIARDGAGGRVGLSPYALHWLDLDRNEMTIVAESDDADLLLPRAAADGSLYFVRRPYQPTGVVSPWRLLADVVLFPFRLLRAVAHFLNFFSLMFSRQPLISAGGPPRDGPDARALMLWGAHAGAARRTTDNSSDLIVARRRTCDPMLESPFTVDRPAHNNKIGRRFGRRM